LRYKVGRREEEKIGGDEKRKNEKCDTDDELATPVTQARSV
jgi:hypothetical protein